MKTPNFDKQAEKFLITLVKKLKNISVIDIIDHDIPYQFENELQTNCTQNTVKYNTVQHYFCEAVPNAAVFIVVFQVYINYFILKFK